MHDPDHGDRHAPGTPGSTGVELSQAFFRGCVGPLLERGCPGVRYVAGRFGTGSDVLGFDDEVSRDHDWGLRLTLLVEQEAVPTVGTVLEDLPESFDGSLVRFAFSGGAPQHHVDVLSVGAFLLARLGLDPRQGMSAADWLSLTGQSVLEATAGPVFHDPDGVVSDLRRRLARYPADVRRLVLAADWARIGEELPLMGRAGQAGDELGSAVIAARLVHAALHLAFTVEDRWAPYSKWLGTGFARLDVADEAGPHLARVLAAAGWQERQAALAAALDVLLTRQDGRDRAATTPFWDRPFLTVDPRVVEDLLAAVEDPALLTPALRPGSVEQRTDLVPLLVDPAARRALLVPPERGDAAAPGRAHCAV